MEQEFPSAQYQLIVKQLIRIAPVVHDIVMDQLNLVSGLNAQNMFRMDQEHNRVELLNGLFSFQFHTVPWQQQVMSCHFYCNGYHAEALEDFFLHETAFMTGDQKPLHSMFLRNKVQQFKQLIMDEIYRSVDGESRVRGFMSHLSLIQAEIVDHMLIRAGLYKKALLTSCVKQEQAIPEMIIRSMVDICSLKYSCDDDFLAVQPLMDSYEEFCFSASQFLPQPLYRIMALSFEESFCLHDLLEHQDDIELLYQHAVEKSHLLGFVRLMNRESWHRNDVLCRQNFLQPLSSVWQKKVSRLPLFDYSRAVHWLFRQHECVLDWLCCHIQHTSVRVAVIALSFVDCSRMHPQVILAVLQHFQYASARMFIHSCDVLAAEQHWFQHEKNSTVFLKGQQLGVDDQRVAISPSILYLDEWLELLRNAASSDERLIKQVFLNMSRVMQAYMQYVQNACEALPEELMPFIHFQNQQNRGFQTALQRYRMTADDFRQKFYLRKGQIRESVFDSFTRDYVMDSFSQHRAVPKNLSWKGLFHKAVDWHHQVHKEEILAKLKKEVSVQNWRRVTSMQQMYFSGWCFEEIADLDRLIEESQNFHHCLAVSYAQRIIEGEYVAFHMSSPELNEQLTLGCHILQSELIFDQLEYPANKKAEQALVAKAEDFIAWLNLQLQNT